jgi:hypothetical protein
VAEINFLFDEPKKNKVKKIKYVKTEEYCFSCFGKIFADGFFAGPNAP